MIYSSLKIGPNGGIVADMEKVYQDNNSVTLAIGIGGTGVSALKTFKNAVYTRLIPDNADKPGEEPLYNRIKFLAIDSDKTSCDGEGYARITTPEYLGIGVSNIVQTLNNKHSLDSDFTLQWFDHDKIHVDMAKDGACGVREIGRFLIIKKAYELKTRIENILRTAMVGLANPNVYVHIFSGISGGTGSGCFIDTCYIVQQALADNGWLDMTSVMGFFFLPDVNLNAPGFPNDLAHTQYIQENGYAAMKELDYLMNLKDGNDFFEQDYGNFKVHSDNPPVNECHLVSTTEIDGSTPVNAYSYIMNAVSEYALNYVARYKDSTNDANVHGSNGSVSNELTLKGLVANLVTLRGAVPKQYGANYRYNIMGASSAIIPYREIATYLATGLFSYFDYYRKTPSEANVRNFAEVTGLSFIDLERELLNGVMPPTVPDMPAAQLKQGNAPLVNRLNAWYDTSSGKMKENYDKLTRSLPEGRWDIPQNPDSVIGRVFKELIIETRDAQKGPYYAKNMLRHDNQLAVDNVLAGVLKEVQERIQSEQIQRNLREQELNKAKDEFYNTGSLNPLLNTRKKKYVEESINWINHLHNLERLSIMEDLITNIRSKLKTLYSAYFSQLIMVLDNIKETFDENRKLFVSGLHHDTGKQYVWNIVELDGIKDTLDDEIKKVLTRDQHGNITAEQAMVDFAGLITEPKNVDKWMSGKEGIIAMLISSFITSKFREAIDKSMITYLRQKYNTDGENLIGLIANNVIGEGLVSNATPAFYADSAMFNIQDNAPIQCVLSVPESESLIEKAAEKYRDDHGMHMSIRSTAIRDRISMMWFYTGVPMYAYRSLRDLEKTYKRAGSAGVHLYEKGKLQWRTYLPSPIPATCIVDSYEPERLDRSRIDTIKEAYEYAKEKGIIVKDIDETIEIPMVESLDCESLEAKAAESEVQRLAVITQLERMVADFVKNSTGMQRVALPSGIDPRRRDNANLDVLVKFTKIGEILKHTVHTHKDMTALMSKLMGESQGEKAKNMELFMQALYAGIIKTNGNIFKYVYEQNGLPEEKQFTSSTKEFHKIPIYQAAIEFATMNDIRLRKRIEAETTAVLDQVIPQSLIETAEKIEAFYNVERLQEYLDEAEQYGNTKEEIKAFLGDWKQSLRKFIRDNKENVFF